MSAYIVDRNHIRFLVASALHVNERGRFHDYGFRWHDGKSGHQLDQYNATRIGQMLWDECINSVKYRYPEPNEHGLPGPIEETFIYEHIPPGPSFEPTPAQIIKAVRCYQYQSCEHPEWETSSAHAFCNELIMGITSLLPDYEEAPWGAPEIP